MKKNRLMSNSTNLFWYAVQKHEYLAILGLLLEQTWVLVSIRLITRLAGYVVMMLSIGLMVFVTITMTREVTPVITQPRTWKYSALHWTIVVGSFNIFFNFISAAVFSKRLGRALPSQRSCCSITGNFPRNIENISTNGGFYNVGTSRDDISLSSKIPLHRQVYEDGDASSDTSSNDSMYPRPFKERESSYSCFHAWFRPFHPSRCSPPLASVEVLRELERLSLVSENYTPKERRYKLLDAPRRRCKTCCRLKAPREHHCSLCNECVAKMDHHCMFLNNCVDVENQRYFVLFVLWLQVMSFFVVCCAGYGWLRQMTYERQLRQVTRELVQNLEMDSRAELQKHVLYLLHNAPYGPVGAKLISTPVSLSIMLACVAIIFTGLFNVLNFIQVWRNVTPIESITIRHKRRCVFSMTSFWYRSPYDLGPWRNFIEVFRTVDDPVVLWALQRTSGMGTIETASRVIGTPSRSHDCLRLLILWLQRVAVMIWLMAMPTLQPSVHDGIHYPVYDHEVQYGNGQTFTISTGSPVTLL
ncbi:unnamed protein product [Phytomonas sp. Hart1]|nr:unnamed protein product [Phytomonas sp. Hart1]|eukprot:CCW70357.1 unnamed protein product [Phytomonas sp. isolate Hart1]